MRRKMKGEIVVSETKTRIFNEEKIIHPSGGFGMLFFTIVLIAAGIAAIIAGGFVLRRKTMLLEALCWQRELLSHVWRLFYLPA